MDKIKYWSCWLVACFLLSGCIHNGRIATEMEIVESSEAVKIRNQHRAFYLKAEEGRKKYFNSYKIIWGWWDKL